MGTLLQYLQQDAAATMGYERHTDDVSLDRPLMDQGIDSLMAVQLKIN